jgi:hypothetical protein
MQTNDCNNSHLFVVGHLESLNNQFPHFAELLQVWELELLHDDIENAQQLDNLLFFRCTLCIVVEEKGNDILLGIVHD